MQENSSEWKSGNKRWNKCYWNQGILIRERVKMVLTAFGYAQKQDYFYNIKSNLGLLWCHSGWESVCQCRGHWFEPWSGKIPHAVEHLGPWTTTTEPARLEPVPHNKRGCDSERPAHREEEWPPLATTRESPRIETKTQHSQINK